MHFLYLLFAAIKSEQDGMSDNTHLFCILNRLIAYSKVFSLESFFFSKLPSSTRHSRCMHYNDGNPNAAAAALTIF